VKDQPLDYSRLVLKELNYNSYLKIPELLDLQRPVSEPAHHDEMFFIIIHQSFELWFKEILHETDLLVAFFREGRISRVLKVLKRIHAILGLLVRKIELLDTLTPVEFAGFRERLRPASGFQSIQFREIEFAFGLREEFFFRFFRDDPFALERLRRRFEAPSVRDEFLAALAADGYPVPAEALEGGNDPRRQVPPALVETLCSIYTRPGDQYHWTLVFEALLDLDTLFSKWRAVHVLMVARTIGRKSGTGGSEGVKFLETRLDLHFFPELWEVRNLIGARFQEAGAE